MNLYDIIFYLFAIVTIVSATFVVFTKNIVYAAYNLLLTLFGIAGLYVLLGADFIGIVQLIIYVGGILILILFGVMLTNKITDVPIKSGVLQVIPASIGVGMLAGILILIVTNISWRNMELSVPESTIGSLGMLLMNEYILIFELLGMLLLIALIGAANIARK